MPGASSSSAAPAWPTPPAWSAWRPSSKASRPDRLAVVLSASRGVTDALLALVAAAERQEDTAPALAALRTRHVGHGRGPVPGSRGAGLYERARRRLPGRRRACCRRCGWRGRPRRATSDLVVGFGELWSTRLFARALVARGRRPGVRWVDARDIVRGGVGAPGPGRALGGLSRQGAARRRRRVGDHADRARLHRPRPAGHADHARAQRQRLLGLDLRRPAERLGDPHLDRRRRRAERRPAPRARRPRDRRACRTTRRWSWPTSAPR